MARTALGVIVGFFAWIIMWFATERVLSAAMPDWYGAPQLAFQNAVENGGEFTAETRLLISHILIGSIVSILSGFLAALVSGGNRRAPLILGVLLLALGLMKVVMSWPYVPIWYHALFTALLLPMVIVGGRLKSPA